MSNKTIAKFLGLVILVSAGSVVVGSCSHASSTERRAANSAGFSRDYESPVRVGSIESADVTESSGLAASLCQPGVLWTHNDSGDDAFIFAMTSAGKRLGTWRVTNAKNADWEDMATTKSVDGTCYLYIGDIGNNKLEKVTLRVYRVKEPLISEAAASSTKQNPLQSEPADSTVFKYSDTPHNSETLMVQPSTGDVYVLTKRVDGPSLVFRIVPQFGAAEPVIAEKVGQVAVPSVPNGFLTGGAISPDGGRVILCDYSAGYQLTRGTASGFDEIWKSTPVPVDLGDRKQGEAVTFAADGKAIYATSERKNADIFEIKIK